MSITLPTCSRKAAPVAVQRVSERKDTLHHDGAEVTDEGANAQRNRLLRLLVERVALVRRCARRVFKAHPDVLQEVTSAYERERRARARQARAEGKGTDEDVAEGEDAADDDTNDG